MLQTSITPVRWEGDTLVLLDQRALPGARVAWPCTRVEEVEEAIRTLAVRGAPLIGVTAAYALVLAARQAPDRAAFDALAARLAAARPTAVNLRWAVERACARTAHLPMARRADALLAEARAIHAEDAAACRAMAEAGAALLPAGARLLTHCNTGALATGGIGTALGVIRLAHARGVLRQVWVDETRPLLQGARLTAWELQQEGIPYRLICDNMAAALMAAGAVDGVLVGADRITRDGSAANKIGTYGLAVLAAAHGIPFYVVAPTSTIDHALATGAEIPVEQRDGDEVRTCGGTRLAPAEAPTWNPAFDVTPGARITAIITERGVWRPGEQEAQPR